jgi:hypothetical protein
MCPGQWCRGLLEAASKAENQEAGWDSSESHPVFVRRTGVLR